MFVSNGWTRDRVLQLAPDASSAKAGQDLANARKWVTLGGDDTASFIWGECQGSGSKPYQVQVDLREPAFKCSCPSRKFPCKHSIGLLLILSTATELLKESAPPKWVEEWVASRASKAQK